MLFGRTDALITRYLDGLMSSSERDAFLRRLETDPDLRRTLTLEQEIRRVMMSDAQAIPAAHTASRARAMAMAASTPASGVEGPGGGTPGGGMSARSASNGKGPTGTGIGGVLAAGLILKIILGVVATAVIVAAVMLLTTGQNTYQTATPRVERRAWQPPPLLSPPAIKKPAGVGASVPKREIDTENARLGHESARRVAATPPQSRTSRPMKSRTSRMEPSKGPAADAAEGLGSSKSGPPVFRSDSLRAKVHINPRKP